MLQCKIQNVQYIVHTVDRTYSAHCMHNIPYVQCTLYAQYTVRTVHNVCTIYCKSYVARRRSDWYSQLTSQHVYSLHIQNATSHLADGGSRPLRHANVWDWHCPLRQLLSSSGCQTVTMRTLQVPPKRWCLSTTYTASQARRLLQGS
jgi:hypothetical protein